MKTSFYFVLWFVIYPVRVSLYNDFANNGSFFSALVIVCGLSWLLNRLIIQNIMVYEKDLKTLPIMGDVYNGNITSFKKRLSRDTNIALLTSVYFIISTVVVVSAIFEYGINDWFVLILFGFITYSCVSQSFRFYKSKMQLNINPVTGVCIEICKNIYKLDYWKYEWARDHHIPDTFMISSTPRFFKIFKIVSIAFACIAMILGLSFMFVGISGIIGYVHTPHADYGMRFLYGSLVVYFGVKDLISCLQTKTSSTLNNSRNFQLSHDEISI